MLALRVLAMPGSVLLAEQLTFPGLITAACDIGLKIIPVKTGESGIDLDDLRVQIESLHSQGRPIAGLYLMPTAANPTGTCLSAEQRRVIAHLAKTYDVMVIEDDALPRRVLRRRCAGTDHQLGPASGTGAHPTRQSGPQPTPNPKCLHHEIHTKNQG